MIEKNIFIQSDSFDKSTDDVLAWLYYLEPNVTVHTIYDTVEVENVEINLSNKRPPSIKINGNTITANQAYWYRRGQFSFDSLKNGTNKNSLERKVAKEYTEPISDYIVAHSYANGINKFDDNNIEKLNILNDCIGLNINIPDTLVTSSFESVKDFLKKHKRIICKSAKNPFTKARIGHSQVCFSAPTKLITCDNIDDYPKIFFTSLFQQYIPKKIELRSFYLKGTFYTMAIFSQNNPKTKIDFRNYDRNKPNRTVPYQLPETLQNKLIKLMEMNRLDCGSFDIILTPNQEYVFLEVNPIGQFQWLSRNCNYFLEKKIAELLLKNQQYNGK